MVMDCVKGRLCASVVEEMVLYLLGVGLRHDSVL